MKAIERILKASQKLHNFGPHRYAHVIDGIMYASDGRVLRGVPTHLEPGAYEVISGRVIPAHDAPTAPDYSRVIPKRDRAADFTVVGGKALPTTAKLVCRLAEAGVVCQLRAG